MIPEDPAPRVTTDAPGKLYLLGEYAVVEPGRQAVLVAVDRRVTVQLRDLEETGLLESPHAPDPTPVTWRHGAGGPSFSEEGEGYYRYVRAAITVVETWRAESGLTPRHYGLRITSGLDDAVSGAKFGLGSSAAVTVAVVGAVAAAYGLDPTPEQIYRLALMATVTVTTLTSGGDLAASALGGWVHYASPDRQAVADMLARDGVSRTLRAPWPGLRLELALPAGTPLPVRLAIGWTGTPADTPELVGAVRRTARIPQHLLQRSDAAVTAFRAALRAADVKAAGKAVDAARAVLAELSALRGTVIETPHLRVLRETAAAHGWAAKSSGAGGGDCGIALAARETDPGRLGAAWSAAGIRPLDLAVAPEGLRVRRTREEEQPMSRGEAA